MKNMMFKTAIAGVAATVGFTAVGLEAAHAQHFYLGGHGGLDWSYDYEKDGLDLHVTGFSTSGRRKVYQDYYGIGVYGGRRNDNSVELDGYGKDESLLFDFKEHTVRLVSAVFSRVGKNDDFEVYVDHNETPLVSADIIGGNKWDTGFGYFNFLNLDGNEGSKFEFTVQGKNDDYFLKSLKVEKVVEAVPEPALMLGLGSVAAAGLLAQKRSRKETA